MLAESGLITALYAGLAMLLTWPAVLAPGSRLAAPVATGDPLLNLWILGWDLQTISRDPLAVLDGRIFQASIFHPADLTLAYSDHLIPQAVALWPVYVLTGNLTLCYNLLLVGSLVASALAMYLFTRLVTGCRAGALVAGVALGFGPYHFAHLLHVQLQGLWTLPLTFLFLHRVAAARHTRDALLLGVFLALQAASSAYYGVIGGLGLTVGAGVLAWGTGQVRRSRFWSRMLLAAVVAAVLVAPFVWPYWQVQQREGLTRNLYEAGQHAAGAVSYLRVPPGNVIYGRTGWLRPSGDEGSSGPAGPERELFPGFVLAGLAVLGAWRSRRRSTWPLSIMFLGVGVTGFLLSLGPEGPGALYTALHRFVFGFQAVRAPARFGVLVLFSLAALAALGVADVLRQWPRWRGALPVVLLPLILAEYANVPLPTTPAPTVPTPAGEWLANAPEPGAVVYLPLHLDAENTRVMIESLTHGRRIVNGYSGQRPAFFVPLVESVSTFPSAEALWALGDLGVRFVVANEDFDRLRAAGPEGAPTPLVERVRFGATTIWEVRWTDDIVAAMPRPAGPLPPPPGPIPFAVGERAVYEVTWKGAGNMGLAAGEAVFAVEDPAVSLTADPSGAPGPLAAPARYRLTLEARTAPWVARFFEAADRFETWTDERLFPLVQHQHIREGRRRIDRVTTYDASRQTVAVAGGPVMSLTPGSRDPVAAYFYARTLGFEPGVRIQVPVSEGGRRLLVDIEATSLERLDHAGDAVETVRLDLRIEERLRRRRPMEATIYLSRDARRIPIVVEVATGFGAFRAVLTSHRAR